MKITLILLATFAIFSTAKAQNSVKVDREETFFSSDRIPVYIPLKGHLEEKVTSMSCDLLKEGFQIRRDFSLKDAMKKKQFRKSRQRQNDEIETWNRIIDNSDKLCRESIGIRLLKSICSKIRTDFYVSPC